VLRHACGLFFDMVAVALGREGDLVEGVEGLPAEDVLGPLHAEFTVGEVVVEGVVHLVERLGIWLVKQLLIEKEKRLTKGMVFFHRCPIMSLLGPSRWYPK
jgi:hypothetical protein